jgi:hypothetical protein
MALEPVIQEMGLSLLGLDEALGLHTDNSVSLAGNHAQAAAFTGSLGLVSGSNRVSARRRTTGTATPSPVR